MPARPPLKAVLKTRFDPDTISLREKVRSAIVMMDEHLIPDHGNDPLMDYDQATAYVAQCAPDRNITQNSLPNAVRRGELVPSRASGRGQAKGGGSRTRFAKSELDRWINAPRKPVGRPRSKPPSAS